MHAVTINNPAIFVTMAGVPLGDLLRVIGLRVVPVGLVLGASMEAFMFYTGFWDVAIRKENERRAERAQNLRALPPPGLWPVADPVPQPPKAPEER